jgi:hypothetical protein
MNFWYKADFKTIILNETPIPTIQKETWIDEVLPTSNKGLHLKN